MNISRTREHGNLSIFFLSIFCLFLFPSFLRGQEKAKAKKAIEIRLEPSAFLSGIPKPRFKQYADSIEALQAVSAWITSLRQQGWLEAQYQYLRREGRFLRVQFSPGERYYWKQLDTQLVPEEFLREAKYKKKKFKEKPYTHQELLSVQNALLGEAENRGYPFAEVGLDSITIEKGLFEGRLSWDLGPEIRFDSLALQGSFSWKPRFAANFLRIRAGDLFDQSKIERALLHLRQLPYLSIKQAPQIQFTEGLAKPRFYVDKRAANRINGIIGVLPNAGNGSRTLITGDFQLELQNLLSTGKYLKAQWRRLQEASQLLDLEYQQPRILGSKLDAGIRFFLNRRDSTFLNREWRFTLWYTLDNLGKFGLDFQDDLSNVLADASELRDNNLAQEITGSRFTSFGLRYERDRRDNPLYPRQGWRGALRGLGGNKVVELDAGLSDTLFTGLDRRSLQLRLEGSWENHWKLSPKSGLFLHWRAAYLFNENLFLNELFQIGGLTTLRGHNENVFFASAYQIVQVEYRIYSQPDSYFFAFYDQAWYRQALFNSFQRDFPLGIGMGINFAVRNGIFTFVYALGQSADQSAGFQQSKVHFGYTNKF